MSYTRPMAKRVKKKSSMLFPYLLIIIGLALVSVWVTHRYFYNRALRLSDSIVELYRKDPGNIALPTRITIPGIVSLPVVESTKVNGTWTVSAVTANHVHASASPGSRGNIIIYAHNLKKLFGNMKKLKRGQIINIVTSDGILHQYKVDKIQTVNPTQSELLAPTPTEVLTLYTCTGFFDAQRLVVRAEPVKK